MSSNSLDEHACVAMRVTCNRELYKGGERSCRHVELDIAGTCAEYVTGDHVAIMPDNDPQVTGPGCMFVCAGTHVCACTDISAVTNILS